MPQSIVAKSNAYLLHPFQAAVDLLAYVGTRSRSSLRSWSTLAISSAAVVTLWLYVVGSWSTIRENREALPLVLFAPIYALALSVANPLLFIWYFVPLLLFLATFAYLGILRFAEAAGQGLRTPAMGICVAGLLMLEWSGTGGLRGWLVALQGREDLYQAAATDLRSSIAPGTSIGLPEIGVFGYVFADHRVVDTVGLVTPQAIPHLLKQPAPGQTFTYAISEQAIEELMPDYLITLEIFVRPTLLQSPDFQADYQLIQRFDTGALDSDGLLVFRRLGAP